MTAVTVPWTLDAVDTGEVVLDVATAGPEDGPPVVLLHGFPESRREWEPLAPYLVAAGLRVIAPDQRGYSATARLPEKSAYRLERLVGDVVGLLDALDLESAHLVGHDWGAMVAWCVAASHPGRVRTLTAVSVPHPQAFAWARTSDVDQQQRSLYIDFFAMEGKAERLLLEDGARRLRAMYGGVVPDDLVDHHVSVLEQPGALTSALSWYRATPLHVFEHVPPVTVPTTYVWGDADTALGRAGAERCADWVTGPYRFVELPGTSHWVPEEEPEHLAREVLAQVRGAGEEVR
jgi:pimeloyl-ACP methyl ester carboxylesterase